jgi:hypothetical protein
MDIELLKTKTKPELIEIAKQVNAHWHHANKEETIINNIMEKVFEPAVNEPKREQASHKKAPVFLTEQEVEKALERIKAQRPRLSTSYDHESRCVTLCYNDGRYKHSETMNLSNPINKIIRKAGEVARGPLVLRPREGDWEPLGGVKPKNAYTNLVL